MAGGGGARNSQGVCRLGFGQAHEVAKSDEFGLGWLDLCEFLKCNIEVEQFVIRHFNRDGDFVQRLSHDRPAPFDCQALPGLINENSLHGLRRGCEKMASIDPFRWNLATDKPEIGFVDERGRPYQRITGFAPKSSSSNAAQFGVHPVDERMQGLSIATGIRPKQNREITIADVGIRRFDVI